MRLNLANNASAVLQADISADDTILTVDSTEIFPEVPFPLTLNKTEEIVYVTAVDGNTLTVDRAQEDTTAGEYKEGTEIWLNFTAGAYKRLVDYVDDEIKNIPEPDLTGYAKQEDVVAHTKKDATNAHDGVTLLHENKTIKVGEGAEFETINEALEYLTTRQPKTSTNTVKAIIELQSGFVMKEQVIVEGVNLSWIEITSIDDEVSVDGTNFKRETVIGSGNGIIATLSAVKGGTLPVIGCVFSLDKIDKDIYGIAVTNNSKAIIQRSSGFKNASYHNVYANNVSTIEAYGCIASGAGRSGIYATQASSINANNSDASGAGEYGVYANQSSAIEFWGGDASGASSTGIRANQGSRINATNAKAKIGDEESPDDIYVSIGSTISVYGTTEGGTSQSLNKVTSSGIIFG